MLTCAIEQPLDVDVGNLHFDGIDHVEGRAGPSIEDATQGGGRLLEEISEDLLSHVLVFHKLSDSVFCFHLVSF